MVINLVAYIDRVNLSVATPLVMKEFGLNAMEMGAIMSVFFVGYGIMNTPGGILADKLLRQVDRPRRSVRMVPLHVDYRRRQLLRPLDVDPLRIRTRRGCARTR